MRASVTRAAQGLDRRASAVDEVPRMREAGIILDDESFELIEGEIVPMQAKTHVHELLKSAPSIGISKVLPENPCLGVETTIYLAANTFVEPGLVVYRRGLQLECVKGADLLLAVEVALTSLAYDNGLKARLYARHGAREFWVIDAARRRTFVHTAPSAESWGQIRELAPDAALPGFAPRLDEV